MKLGLRGSDACLCKFFQAQSGRRFKRIVTGSVPCEVEGQFTANDQLFQEFVSYKLVLAGIFLRRNGHFQSADMAEMQIRAEVGSRVRSRLVAIARISAQSRFKEVPKPPLRFDDPPRNAGDGLTQ